MALGYEGLATISFGGAEERVLCTAASVPKSRTRLESSSGYGGQISTPVNEMGIGFPRNYDWTVWDGSVSFEVHRDAVANIIKPWMFDRQNNGSILLSSRSDNQQAFSNAFWNSISLNAAEGSVVDSSLGFVAIDRDVYQIGGGYIVNKTGQGGFCDPAITYTFPPPLNPCGENINPIPFWNTTVAIDSVLTEFINWNLQLSQEVVKFFSCEANATPQEPKFLAVGPLAIAFTGDYIFLDDPTGSGFVVPDSVAEIDIALASGSGAPEIIKLRELELTTDTDAVQSPEALTPIAVDYAVYQLAV